MKKRKMTAAEMKLSRVRAGCRLAGYVAGRRVAMAQFWREIESQRARYWRLYNAASEEITRLRAFEASNAPEAASLWERLHGVIPDQPSRGPSALDRAYMGRLSDLDPTKGAPA